MSHLHISRLVLRIAVAMGALVVLVKASDLPQVEAQTAPFIISPYYGTANINQGYIVGHEAYDFSLNYAAVLAGEQGTVGFAGWWNNDCHHYRGDDPDTGLWCGYGLYQRIDHPNGYRTFYAHRSSVIPTQGGAVQQGQVIGTSGNTGWSTGPHLHFEVRNANNVPVDPFNPNLWKDGQWTGRLIPEPVNGGEFFVDDTTDNTGGFSKGEFTTGHFLSDG